MPNNNKNNILIYPKFKKASNKELVNEEDIALIANHYTYQFYEAMKNHGVKADPIYFKDLTFLREVIKSIISRTQGKYHSIQDWMDDSFIEEMHDGIVVEEEDLIEEDE